MPNKGYKWTPEQRKIMVAAHIGRRVKHGLSSTLFYKCWENMKERCGNPKTAGYPVYGGRGIRVEWKEFVDFKNDMYESYLEHKKNNSFTSIERINNDGNYSKENCRWATRKEQHRNTSRTIHITIAGVQYPLTEAAKKAGLRMSDVKYRMNRFDISFDKAVGMLKLETKAYKRGLQENIQKRTEEIRREVFKACGCSKCRKWENFEILKEELSKK